MPKERWYVCIDLKSFYASVECVDRGLDPFAANLVVADPERSRGTICLAITPAMKALGVKNRCRVYEIPEGIDYVTAVPRMRRYMDVSAHIYGIYLRYAAPEDIHVYSVDECFIDVTPYLRPHGEDARSFAARLMRAVFSETGICATAGVGTNLFLAKVALDLLAKKSPDNIGELDERSFRRDVWFHRPITDIWGIGPATARRLERFGARDLAGVCAIDEAALYREFGVNAEFLIDHAWGQEPCTMSQIKAYRPKGASISNGQVLPEDYTADDARIVLREMVDEAALDLQGRGMTAGEISVWVGYSWDAAERPSGASRRLASPTDSRTILQRQISELFDDCVSPGAPLRRIGIGLSRVEPPRGQMALFEERFDAERERGIQDATRAIRARFGKNALLRASSLLDKATAIERNEQIGGHRA